MLTRQELHCLVAAIIYAGDPETRRSDDQGRHPKANADKPDPYNATVVADSILCDVENHYPPE